MAKADLILVMESGHRRVIDANEPTARGKVYRLGEWQDLEIPDPYRQPREAFEAALEKIDKSIADWVERLKN
jgi:protein-tyrosine phosphatase